MISYKQRLDEHGVPARLFYVAKRKYAHRQESGNVGEVPATCARLVILPEFDKASEVVRP